MLTNDANKMKRFSKLVLVCLFSALSFFTYSQTGSIRINQLGYYPDANKIAVVVFTKASTFEIINTADNSVELTGNLSAEKYWIDAGDSVKQCNFSALTKPGIYKIRIPDFGESYPFEVSQTVLRKAAYASLKSYYYQRSSFELKAPYAGLWARPAGHPDNVCILHSSTGKTGTISSPGGWYDAGDYGKYVINAGISVATMLSFYENFNYYFADSSILIPESGNGENDLLDEVKFELDWLKTMQDTTDGGVYFKLTTLGFSGMVMPAADKAARYVIGKTSASALDFAAMMAMAGRIYKDYDSVYAADCIKRAENAWIWAKANPAIYFKNPADVSTGEYGDGNVSDEFIWAAAELFITTQKAEYKTYLEGKSSSLKYSSAPGWPGVQPLASLSLATQANGLSDALLTTIKNSIVTTSDNWINQININPCRIPTFGFNWGSNSGIANQGVGLLYAYIITKDTKYIKAAAECADYLLGKNATGFSFVSSYGYKTPMYFHHRPSHADGIAQPIPGFVSGGPNSGKQDGVKYPFSEPAKCFVDIMDSYASNEVCINWNSPLTALLAGVDAILGDSSDVAFEVPLSINNPPVLSLNSPAYDAKISTDQALAIKGTATDAADGISKLELYINSRYYGELPTSPFQWTLDTLPTANHTATVIAYDTKGLSSEKTTIFRYYPVCIIPGKIEAEDFSNMTGITTQKTSDTNGGLNITTIDATDWMDYSVNVEQAGSYIIEFRVASSVATGKFELRKAALVLSSNTVKATGGLQKWSTISDTIKLSAGKQTLRIHAVAGSWNINWINLTYYNTTSISDNTIGETGYSFQIAPNPVKSNFKIKYNTSDLSPIEFTLYDNAGKQIDKKRLDNIQAFDGEFNWILSSEISAGVYSICFQQNGLRMATGKLIKMQD